MRSIDYPLAARLCRKHKAALTRAKKKGPRAVVTAVNAFYADFRDHDLPLPDQWSTWEVAKNDALGQLIREDRGWDA